MCAVDSKLSMPCKVKWESGKIAHKINVVKRGTFDTVFTVCEFSAQLNVD